MVDAMTPEVFAAAVAEKVMGWKPIDRRRAGWGDGLPVWETDSESSPTFQGFTPAKSADHDYRVLQRVRETWSENQRERFAMWLESVIYGRIGKACASCEPADLELIVHYEPGDYATSALLVVLESEATQ